MKTLKISKKIINGDYLMGSFLDENSFDELINYDCDVYDSSGILLAKFRKNVLSKQKLIYCIENVRSSIVKNWGGGKKIVECVNFNDVLKHGGNCKIDIEGAEMLLIEKLNTKLNKLVFEWSFDIDDDINRYRKSVDKMKILFNKVHAGNIDKKHSKWLKSWFPPCKNVFCYND